MQQRRSVHIALGAAAGAVLVFVLGFYAGRGSIPAALRVTDVRNAVPSPAADVGADFEPFWRAWNIINEKYAGAATATAPQDKVWGAIEGLAESLGDPYSVFLPPEEAEDFAEMITGTFGGVGMEIGEEEGRIVVIAPLKGSPAEGAGIEPGDAILQIDETPAADLSVDEAVGLIRGEPGTVVTLTLAREQGEPFEVTLVRDTIVIPTLATEVRGEVFIVSLYNFDAFAAEEFRGAVQEFAASGKTKLVLDLRGNPGGFLDAAVDIASWFLPKGEVVVREQSGYGEQEGEHRSKGYRGIPSGTRVVVLIDRGSASASEIVAGALSEHGVAELVGQTTFGKGSVQELIGVTPDTALKLTVAQWLTPSGKSISEGGLAPDVEVEMTREDAVAGGDPQLDAALEILAK